MSQSLEEFMRKVVSKLTPEAARITQDKDSGHFIIHFGSGEFKAAKVERTL